MDKSREMSDSAMRCGDTDKPESRVYNNKTESTVREVSVEREPTTIEKLGARLVDANNHIVDEVASIIELTEYLMEKVSELHALDIEELPEMGKSEGLDELVTSFTPLFSEVERVHKNIADVRIAKIRLEAMIRALNQVV